MICSAVTLFLTISYLRLVVGWRFAAVESGLAQLVYLILFSYALFNEGSSGLTITIGAIVTLFVVMQRPAESAGASDLPRSPRDLFVIGRKVVVRNGCMKNFGGFGALICTNGRGLCEKSKQSSGR